MEYVLRLDGPEDSPRLREIHTAEEVVHPAWSAGTWTATVRTASASAALRARRYGFTLISENAQPGDFALPDLRSLRVPNAQALRALGLAVHDGEPTGAPACPAEDWLAWRGRKRTASKPVAAGDLFQRLRCPVPVDTLLRAAEIARSDAWIEPAGEAVAIVLVFHGWSERDRLATVDALDAAAALGPAARVVVVQNDPRSHAVAKAWRPRSNAARYTLLTTRNDGFAAACNAGAKVAAKASWLLFTQGDARWGPEAVRDAIGLSRALASPPVGFGQPALVGPSGGCVLDHVHGGLAEYGRNVARDRGQPPRQVDWIAGYWLLVDGAVFRKVGGWSEDYFLYFEDPDLSLRCALAGARPFAWPDLQVEHERGGTIKAAVPGDIVSAIREESRRTFAGRWG